MEVPSFQAAVNLTARLETLARDLGRELLLSAAFARHCPDQFAAIGSYPLRGFRTAQEVFVPRPAQGR